MYIYLTPGDLVQLPDTAMPSSKAEEDIAAVDVIGNPFDFFNPRRLGFSVRLRHKDTGTIPQVPTSPEIRGYNCRHYQKPP